MLRDLRKPNVNITQNKYKYKHDNKFVSTINTRNPKEITLFRTIVNTIGITSYLGFLSINKYNLT